jgi:hypothetical protein
LIHTHENAKIHFDRQLDNEDPIIYRKIALFTLSAINMISPLDHADPAATIRHGMDSIEYFEPDGLLPVEEAWILKRKVMQHQEHILRGFTVGELKSIGCWDKPEVLANDLQIPIHPLYRKEKWINCPDDMKSKGDPIGDGIPGFWEVENPIVWNMLQPILRIATHFITNISLWQW